MTPYQVQRKQIHLQALCGEDGELIDAPEVVIEASRAEWAPIFEARSVDEEAVQRFDDLVVTDAEFATWGWRRGELIGVARLHRSALGPDGAAIRGYGP